MHDIIVAMESRTSTIATDAWLRERVGEHVQLVNRKPRSFTLSSINRTNAENSKKFTNGMRL
jgi:hypothetical protein